MRLLERLGSAGRLAVIATAFAASASLLAPGPARAQAPRIEVEAGSHSGPIRRVSVAPRRGLVVTASDDKTARIWSLADGALRHVLRPALGDGEIGRLYGAAIHPTENRVAVAGTTATAAGHARILLFDTDTGRLAQSIDTRDGQVKKLAWSADGSLLLAVSTKPDALRAFDRRGRRIFEQSLGGPAYGLAIAANGMVAASALDGTITLVEARAGRIEPRTRFEGVGRQPVGLAFSPDATRLLVGFNDWRESPSILDAASGRTLAKLEKPALEAGNLMTVAWSADGATVYAAGTGYSRARRFPLAVYPASGGAPRSVIELAGDSVFDLAPLPDGRLVFASFDGSWGIADADGPRLRVAAQIADLRGPEHLLLSADARSVSWTRAWGDGRVRFDFARRLMTSSSSTDGLEAPRPKRGLFDGHRWQDETRPNVAGQDISLEPGEVSRALAWHGETAAYLGTSRSLRRLDGAGNEVWRVRTRGEVRAVNVAADGRLVVTGMSDGSLRWWRARDGAPVLSLFALDARRWVAWTPLGHFDASAGADRIAGWAVNRADAPIADFFSLGRFRDAFDRPDVIDQALRTADPRAALEQADRIAALPPDDAMKAQAQVADAPIAALEPVPAAPPAVPVAPAKVAAPPAFPPVITVAEEITTSAAADSLRVPFMLRARAKASVEVRVDGRPEPRAKVVVGTPGKSVATSRGTRERNGFVILSLPLPRPDSVVQLIARDDHGISEPTTVRLAIIAALGSGAALPPPPEAVIPVPPVPQPAALVGEASRLDDRPSVPAATPAAVEKQFQAPKRRRMFMVSIGVSNYRIKAYQLGLAAKDARDFVTAWRAQKGRLYDDIVVKTLVDSDATRENVLAALNWLNRSVQADDVGLLFIAGHGVNAPSGGYYFVPYDGDHRQLARTAVPEAAIRTALGNMRGRALFFVDTCHAGNAIGNFASARRELSRLANNLAASENGVIVFASSAGRQESEEDDSWGNGAFTKALIEGLSGKADLNRSGRITYKGLDFYVSEEVRKLTNGRQTPVTISPIGVPDFAIARLARL